MNFYDFSYATLSGKPFDNEVLKGKKVMVVNTASKCGLTPQYKQLEELYASTSRNDFYIIGFPCNDFGQQEPGSADEISSFCELNYGVTFPMMEKISVKGEEQHPLYKWLLEESKKSGGPEEVEWNFHKFLINENGDFVRSVAPATLPNSEEITTWING